MARAKYSKKGTKTQPDFYQEVTDRMIEKLEAGTAPWRCEWNRFGLAKNYVSGRAYRGINAFMLNFFPPFPIPYYVSYKQAQDLGGNIRKGAKSEKVYFYKSINKDEDGGTVSDTEAKELRAGGDSVRSIAFLKSFNVFNVADVEGVDFDLPEMVEHVNPLNERCEQVIRELIHPPKFTHKDVSGAWYDPRLDEVNVPEIKNFHSAEGYYTSLFHELTHSTGHVTRLNREGVAGEIKKLSEGYAREELIAEMGAAFLCAHTQIDIAPVFDNSAAYIANWLTQLRNDKTLVFKGAAGAQKATDYLLNIEG